MERDKFDEVMLRFDTLNESLKRVQKRRDFWNESLRDTITEILSSYQKAISVDLLIQSSKTFEKFFYDKNLEFITIGFGKEASGITSTKLVNGKQVTNALIREGGTLTYNQTYNGKVSVFVKRPAIEGAVTVKEDKKIIWIDTYEPEEMNSNLIADHINVLLDDLIKFYDHPISGSDNNWERKKIGFELTGQQDEE